MWSFAGNSTSHEQLLVGGDKEFEGSDLQVINPLWKWKIIFWSKYYILNNLVNFLKNVFILIKDEPGPRRLAVHIDQQSTRSQQ